MIVGFQVLLIGLLADVISANRKLLEELVYRVRSLEMPTARRGRRAGRAAGADRAACRSAAGNADAVADPAAVSIVIPAYNEAAVIADVVAVAARRGAVARDHRRRRRVEGRHQRARARRRRDRRPPSLQQGQRRRGQDRHPHARPATT